MAQKAITYQGQEFASITALARHLGVTRYTLAARIKKGLPEKLWGAEVKLSQHTNETLDEAIKSKGLNIERIGDIVDTKTPMEFRCLIHDEIHPAQPTNVLQGQGLRCCYLAGVRGQGLKSQAKSAAEYDDRINKANPFVIRLETYKGRGTAIWHLCTKHWEWRRSRPGDILNGHGLKCCLIESNLNRNHERRDEASSEYIKFLSTYKEGIFTLVGDYKGRHALADHYCSIHNETHPTRPNGLLSGQRMICCGRASWAATGKQRMEEASADFVERLAAANPNIELIGEYMGTNTKTLFRCLKHGEEHMASPKQRLRGQGLHCCHVANGKAMGRLTGPLNGWQGDSVWQTLAEKSTRHEPAWLYLYDSPDTELLKYGIASDYNDRMRRSRLHGYKGIRYGELLIEPRKYSDRDQAVLIEGAYQFSYGADASPKLGIGWTELTDRSPAEFIELIIELEKALLEMGAWEFAEEYCDPVQVEKASSFF